MLIDFKLGQTSIVLRVKILDSSVTTGAGKTGLTNSSSGLRIATIADNESSSTSYTAAGSTVDTITTLGTYSAPSASHCRFKEVDATNHPGVYEIQIADARFAVSSAKSLLISISGATNAADCDVVVPLRSVDPYDAVRFGLTALPNVASGSAGAVITSGTGTSQLNVTGGRGDANVLYWNSHAVPAENQNGVPKVDAVYWIGGAIPAVNTTGVPKADLVLWLGNAPNALISGRPDVNAQVVGDKTGYSLTSGEETSIATAVWASGTRTLSAFSFSVTVGTNNDKSGYSLAALDSESLHSGTAQAGAAGTITLASGANSTDDFYQGNTIKIYSGTGAGQSRTITGYVGSTKVATVDRNWKTNPDSSSAYSVTDAVAPKLNTSLQVTAASVQGDVTGNLGGDVSGKVLGGGSSSFAAVGVQADVEKWKNSTPNDLISGRVDSNAQVVGDKTGYALTGGEETAIATAVWAAGTRTLTAFSFSVTVGTNNDKSGYGLSSLESEVLHSGTAQAGGASTITLATGASSTDHQYEGDRVVIYSGTGAQQSRTITGYVGSTRVATVDRAWVTAPDSSSVYKVVEADNPALNSTLQVSVPSSDPWGTALPGSYGAGTAGYLVGTYLDATVSSRARPADILATPAHPLATDDSGRIDVGAWLGSAPNALSSGRVDASVGALANAVITTGAFATGAIDANAFAQAAADKAWSTSSRTLTAFGFSVTVGTNNDKTGYALTSGEHTNIASDVWGAALSSYTAAGTFGRTLQIVRDGTAQAGASASITLDASASGTDDFYKDAWVDVIGGTGVGQSRLCTAYVGSSKVATVAPAWKVQPDSSSVFRIRYGAEVAVQTVNDKTGYSLTGGEESAIATAVWANGTRTLTSNPGLTSSQIAAAVWDEARSSHVVSGSFGEGVASVRGNVVGSVTGDVSGKLLGGGSSVFVAVGAQADVEQWRGSPPNVLISGRPDVNAQAVGDKTGYALSSGEHTAVATDVQTGLTNQGYSTGRAANLDNLDAAVSSRSTYAGADTSGTTTLLSRIPGTVQPQTGDSYARLGAPAGASVSADIAAVKSEEDAIKAKTDNLPASPAATSDVQAGLTAQGYTGARAAKLDNLDAAVSSRSTYAGADTAGTTTLLSRIPGTVQPQTGDAYARLGAPAGASVSADVAAVKSDTGAVKSKTDQFAFTTSNRVDATAVAVSDKTGYALGAAGLDAIPITGPTGPATTFREQLVQLYRRFFKKTKLRADTKQLLTYADDGTTVVTTQAVDDDGITQTQGAAT